MILIGSRAALLMQCLPAWRAGTVDDWDFVGTPAEWEAFKARYGVGINFGTSRYNPDVHQGRCPLGKVEFDASQAPHRLLLATMPDLVPQPVLDGFDVRVAGLETLFALKDCYADMPIQREKNDKDLAAFRKMRGKKRQSAQHFALATATRTAIQTSRAAAALT